MLRLPVVSNRLWHSMKVHTICSRENFFAENEKST